MYLAQLLPKQERFISGRRSCKGCGKALSARIAAKAVQDTAAIPDALMPGISGELASLSSHAYAHDSVSSTAMIKRVLSAVEEINTASEPEGDDRSSPVQKAVIGIDRRVLEDDHLALTQVVEHGQKALYLCFDSEPYIDVLLQKASPLPFVLNEDAIPVQDEDILRVVQQKNMPGLVTEGDFSYVATACPSYPSDFVTKIRKGLETPGNGFIVVLTPCPTAWIFAPDQSLKMGIRAVKTGYFPLYEILEGTLRITEPTTELKPLKEFISAQHRFVTFPAELMPVLEDAVTQFYETLVQKEGNPPA